MIEKTLFDLTLKPSFKSLVNIEAVTGKPLIDLLESLGKGQTSATDITHILHQCAIAGGENITFDNMGEKIMQSGGLNVKVFAVSAELIGAMFQSNNSQDQKKAKGL